MKLLFLDTETCGLHGLPVLLQYAYDDGPIALYDIWREPVGKTLDLIESFLPHVFVGFNCSFDWFQLAKLYTIWSLCPRDWIPEEHIEEIALLEPEGRDGPAIKPASACDLLLHSRKNKYQALMAREDVRIRKVPTPLAYALAEELEDRVQIDGIYFAKSKDKNAPKWKVYDRKDTLDFKDVVLKFNPAGGLKFLAEYALGLEPKFHFKDVEPDTKPKEFGYAPFALAVSSPDKNWEVYKDGEICGHAWPALIKSHIEHWATNKEAREYAQDDIVYTRALYDHFGRPTPGDDNSVLACMVAVVRWRGFRFDIEGMEKLLAARDELIVTSPININKPNEVRTYLIEVMDPIERICLAESTKKAVLEGIAQWEGHPAADRARQLLDIKAAVKEREIYRKLLKAGRFHASFNVIGALSSRMSGGDGLNAQGIKKTKEVRRLFTFCWPGTNLSLGDFASFEVTIADAVIGDPGLRADLQAGHSIHGVFGSLMFKKTYEEIMASKGTAHDMYTIGKSGFFGTILYGGNERTLLTKYGVPLEDGKLAIDGVGKKYKRIGDWRKRIHNSFCSMKQPGGAGTAVHWDEPAEYVESFLGHRRYFTLENKICKELFLLARKTPKHWKEVEIKVIRRDRLQTAAGAASSAIYGAAFNLQAANMRAAANHEIQSPGAEITKRVQRRIWDLQPVGVHNLCVAPINIHDELLCVSLPSYTDAVETMIQAEVERFKEQVPLIAIDWLKEAHSWADK